MVGNKMFTQKSISLSVSSVFSSARLLCQMFTQDLL
eukprot:SAG31_NODE_22375_length_527_cov_0.796729_1_plen_35_part_01